MDKKNSNNKKNKWLSLFESALFGVLLCIIALRLSFAENPHINLLSIPGGFLDNLLSITVSSVLILLLLGWFTAKLWLADDKFKIGIFDIGSVIFVISAIISTVGASNKRAAIVDSTTIFSAMACGMMLIRLLNNSKRRKILLFVVIAIAIANVYQCSEQFFNSNKLMISQYQQEPTVQLEKLGIEPGSFQHMLYEHRLYSKDIKGFFTTSNSAATLLVLAVFCTFAVFKFNSGKDKNQLNKTLLAIVILSVLGSGLLMTHSKGALAALAAAAFILLIVTKFGGYLRKKWVPVTITVVLAASVCTVAIAAYGKKHGSLIGGNSMLVRWQYWSATAKMIADKPIIGLGGGNFASAYMRYKLPQALETVKDPHCFVLSVLSQYGIIGLAGFCLVIISPLAAACKKNLCREIPSGKNIAATAQSCAISILFVLLLVRPLFVRAGISSDIAVTIYVLTIMYTAPAFFFCVALWLSLRASRDNLKINTAALTCGIVAVLIHNLIDFAIFEPGIITALLACAAVVCSMGPRDDGKEKNDRRISTKIILTITSVGLAGFVLCICLIPSAKTSLKIEKAKMLSVRGQTSRACRLLADATDADTLNPTPPSLAGKLTIHNFSLEPINGQKILIDAEKYFLEAVKRDPANYKNYQSLAETYEILAQITPEKRIFWFEKSIETLHKAIERYPGSGKLHIQMAQNAEAIGKIDVAIKHYEKATQIENAYIEQFKVMYPGKEVFSRLGKIKYKLAQEKLEELSQIEDN